MTPRARGDHAGELARPPWVSLAPERVIAIVGAGASGTLVAVNLLRLGGARVILVDPAGHGRGVAYSTCDERHLLNVPACGMSGLADEPEDLLRWCEGRGMAVAPRDFLPRSLYGEYLRELLERFGAPGRVEIVRARVENVVEPPFHGGVRLTLSDGRELTADAAVLAVGNPPPAPLRSVGRPDSLAIVQDPWAPGALGRIRGARRVVIVGTGLTAVDVAMTLAEDRPDVQICALSRHGARPRAHLTGPARAPRPTDLLPGASLAEITEALGSELAREPDAWREIIDGLRWLPPDLWRGMSVGDRERFLSGLRWWWDIRRHRLAPLAADGLGELISAGRMRLRAGTVTSVHPRADGRVAVELVGGETLDADAVVNATGPARSVSACANPLLGRLLRCGRAHADDLGVGLATSADGALIDIEGVVSRRCFTLGPPRRGELFESTAVPEIRVQAAALARLLTSVPAPSALAAERRSRVNFINPIGY